MRIAGALPLVLAPQTLAQPQGRPQRRRRSVVEKMLKVGAAFDYRSRPLLKVSCYSLEKRRSDPDPGALFQGDLIGDIPKLRVLFQNRVDLPSETRVLVSQLALYRSLLNSGWGGSGVVPATSSGVAPRGGGGCNSE